MDTELLDLSAASNYKTGSGPYYQWQEQFDGFDIKIFGVSNLTVRGRSDDRTATVLSVVPRYAHVLNFENCANILVADLTAGHTKEPGSCMGGALSFRNCQDVLIRNSGLYGCGTWGVWGNHSKGIRIADSEIYECSVCGAKLDNGEDVRVSNTILRDFGTPEYEGADFRVYDSKNITCNGEPIRSY